MNANKTFKQIVLLEKDQQVKSRMHEVAKRLFNLMLNLQLLMYTAGFQHQFTYDFVSCINKQIKLIYKQNFKDAQ